MLCTFLLGIVFDTHEGGGCALLGAGYRFRYLWGRGGVFSMLWVSFSIPMRAVGALSWVLGIVFNTRLYIAVFSACLRAKKIRPERRIFIYTTLSDYGIRFNV